MPRTPRPGPRALRAALPLVSALILLLGLAALAARPEPPSEAPEIHADAWLNSEPLTMAGLRGRVVLVEFWTFACWNCKNVEPHLKRWHARYADDGLVTVAVHTPELDFERDREKVRRYVEERGIAYPVAIDEDFVTWKRFRNWAWPTVYLVDRAGRIRHVRVGEGGYDETEARIRALLAEDAPGPD
jgi:thiol-disulfide isomerase/thioredoxin